MEKVYASAVDAWLAALLAGAPAAVVAFGAFTLTTSVAAGATAIAVGFGVGGLIAAFTIPCSYTLSNNQLKVKCGVLENVYPLSRIRTVEKSSSAWSAPALSLRRIKITFDHGYCLISPKDRDSFIADLNARLR